VPPTTWWWPCTLLFCSLSQNRGGAVVKAISPVASHPLPFHSTRAALCLCSHDLPRKKRLRRRRLNPMRNPLHSPP
jgi:hypothetical protein